MKKDNLMKGTLVLSIGAILAKIFSAVYRIGLTRILGGEGIGLYQLVFPLYSLCVVLATAGLPMAISKVIAKSKCRGKAVVKKCLFFVMIISLILSFILISCSKGLARVQGEEEISICYIILAPSIILVSGCSVLRGYFQGVGNFTPSAVSNIIEQFVKLCIGLILSLSLIGISLLASIVGAMISIVASELISLLILFIYYKKNVLPEQSHSNLEIKDLLKDILPITLTNIILPIASFVDSILVVNLLNINFEQSTSVFLYGLESGAVSSLVSLPTIFSFAIASVILPSITSANTGENRDIVLRVAIKIILIITLPFVLCFALIPDRLITLLYGNGLDAMGIGGQNVAYRLLTISGFGAIFLAISQVYSSCLQAVDERMASVRNLAIAVLLKFIIELIFMPSLMLNIYVLSISNLVCYITVMVLNHFEIKQHFKLKFNYIFTGKLILCNSFMLLTLIIVLGFSNSWSNTLLAIAVAGISYVASLVLTKIFTKRDLAMIKYKVK